jgi:iron complex outermembrane receptor protein
VDGSPAASQQLLQSLRHWAWSQELRLKRIHRRIVRLHGGAYYFKQDGTLQARVDLNYAGIDFVHGPDPTPSDSTGLFLHSVFKFTDDLALVAWARATPRTRSRTPIIVTIRMARFGALHGLPVRAHAAAQLRVLDAAAGRSLDGFTPARFKATVRLARGVLDYQFTDDVMAYLNVLDRLQGWRHQPAAVLSDQVLHSNRRR